ncbi:MAG: zf-HC2 domain-containing protein [Planctomycetota bacterium]|nr:zf-HC2 domain-containing protein [Planctomycetota bacterium]
MNDSKDTCREVIEFLASYLDETLEEQARSKFDAHLDVCPYCRDYMTSYEDTIRLARSTGSDAICDELAPLPEQLVQAILKSREP